MPRLSEATWAKRACHHRHERARLVVHNRRTEIDAITDLLDDDHFIVIGKAGEVRVVCRNDIIGFRNNDIVVASAGEVIVVPVKPTGKPLWPAK
jgi:predicted TIM-barrel enzyme